MTVWRHAGEAPRRTINKGYSFGRQRNVAGDDKRRHCSNADSLCLFTLSASTSGLGARPRRNRRSSYRIDLCRKHKRRVELIIDNHLWRIVREIKSLHCWLVTACVTAIWWPDSGSQYCHGVGLVLTAHSTKVQKQGSLSRRWCL